jgi:hypothetical protein
MGAQLSTNSYEFKFVLVFEPPLANIRPPERPPRASQPPPHHPPPHPTRMQRTHINISLANMRIYDKSTTRYVDVCALCVGEEQGGWGGGVSRSGGKGGGGEAGARSLFVFSRILL